MNSLTLSDGSRTARFEAIGAIGGLFDTPGFSTFVSGFFPLSKSSEGACVAGLRRLCDGGGVAELGVEGSGVVDGGSLGVGCVQFEQQAGLGGVGGCAGSSGQSSAGECGGAVGEALGSLGVSVGGVPGAACRGKQYWRNKKRKEKAKAKVMREDWRKCDGAENGAGKEGVDSAYGSSGSVCTVDTRTGVEIAAAQTLAARRVAENEKAEAEAKVAKKLAEHRLVALQDKDRTVAVQRLAAARYEQKINEARAKSQASYKKCDESMKSLGSTGSAGEFALKQMVKEARDNAKTLKYVQEQADLFYQYATPEVRRMVAEMPEPEMEDEFDVFGDCPSDYNDEQREAYYDDLNRRNAEHGLVGSSPVPPRRELTPEEFLKIEEEIRALSANQV